MDKSATERLEAEVRARFGVLPNFFRLAPETPEVTANLWAFARFAYLDNPLPPLFKERLFVYLSRFCEVRYCIVRHLGFLVGLGRPSGDAEAEIMTVDEVLPLLRRPLPSREEADAHLACLDALAAPPAELPPANSALETALFICAGHVFLQSPDAPRCLLSLRHAVGEQRFQYLAVLLSFIRTAHYWTRLHPELELEPDVESLLAADPRLAECLLADPEVESGVIGARVLEELEQLRDSRQREEELRRTNAELVRTTAELTASRRAALSLMDDAIRTQEQLRGSEERFRSVFQHAATGIAIAALDGRLLHCNPAYAALLGYREEELLPLEPAALVHPEDRDAEADGLRRLAGGTLPSFEIESRCLRKDGRAVWVHKHVTLLRDAAGAPMHLLSLVTDITARRHAEAVLRHADRMEAVGRLAGGVAHEANNQMTVVLGCAAMALARPDLPPGIAADLADIRRAAERTAAITAQLLAFGRQQALRPEALDLNQVMESFAPVLRRMLGVSVELAVHPYPDLQPVVADRGQLEQVLVNLAFNARDAMPRGGRLLLEAGEVTLDEARMGDSGEPLRPGGYGMLVVSDTGHGMSPEVLSRIFEPFFTTKPTGQGTGLGLSTVYGIVRQLGGDVQVESRVGEGTTFRILLPVAKAPIPAAASPPPPAQGAGETVLVVEDEPAVRAVAARALRAGGFEVLEAEHGEAALAALAALRGPRGVKAVVSDAAMPVMGGRELAERVAEIDPGLPVLLVSGYAPEELERRGMLAGDSVAFMRKPFAPDALVERVRALLDARAVNGP